MDPLKPTELNANGTPVTPTPPVAPTPAPTPLQHLPPTPESIDSENVPKYVPPHTVHVAPVRSFSTDLANAIREQGGSVVRIAIAEEEKHRRQKEENSASSTKNVIFIIGAMILVLGAIGTLVFAYLHKAKVEQAPVVQKEERPTGIISTEDGQVVDISAMKTADIIFNINAIVTTPNIQEGNIKDIIIVAGKGADALRIPSNQFFNVLASHAPDSLLRSLSAQYQLGVYRYNGNHLFLILKGTAHDYLLSGMIGWEQKLFTDMIPLFNIDTSAFTEAQLQSVPFTDFVIQNQDTRAALSPDKKPLLFYSFIDPNTIVIADNTKTLAEIIRRH